MKIVVKGVRALTSSEPQMAPTICDVRSQGSNRPICGSSVTHRRAAQPSQGDARK
jgi:hypothetical protein